MQRKRHIRKRRGTSWTSESSARANKVRWDADRARRDADEPARLAELAANPPLVPGTPIGSLTWHDHLTGRVRRWTVLLGERRDQVVLRAPDGRTSASRGWTWVLDHLRGHLAGTK